MAEQHAGFFKRLAQSGHIQACGGGGVNVRLTQGGVQVGWRLVQVGSGVQLAICRVQLATRKHIGAAQHIRQAMAFDQKNLQPAR